MLGCRPRRRGAVRRRATSDGIHCGRPTTSTPSTMLGGGQGQTGVEGDRRPGHVEAIVGECLGQKRFRFRPLVFCCVRPKARSTAAPSSSKPRRNTTKDAMNPLPNRQTPTVSGSTDCTPRMNGAEKGKSETGLAFANGAYPVERKRYSFYRKRQ